jgi:hypothetical protein
VRSTIESWAKNFKLIGDWDLRVNMREDRDGNELITTKRNLEQYLVELDPDDIKVRRLIVSAIERLTKDYVLPAMQIAAFATDSIYTFDLDSVAGMEIHNLVRSLFASQFKGLTIPSNAELTNALSTIGINDLDERERNNFYKVWAGEEAIDSIICLIEFLSARNDAIDGSAEFTFQQEPIGEILKLELPIQLHFRFQDMLDRSKISQ